MICPSCRESAHDRCVDNQHQRLYRSCFCLHRPATKTEPATGPAGE